ncbi:ketoacyl-ACP synthase III family protein [Actinocrinis puniceicyclus]|uniref:Ketoacyl-ACP synthase III family protein n=1 Tax=Actinocrinis puniceicyclus TaxID=977794 RepID=A0A8J7WQ98_9ACTN|nr:ketoacyl-ACP synthase III family protein [Actinocrinis puniceicyclus]MBS2964377.1 ketoacyl-ACP synthase III family protein [Actinocrinis puniceicyclus]
MRYGRPVYLSSPSVELGETALKTPDAVAAGLVPGDVAERSGYRELPVTAQAPGRLAQRAALRTLGEAAVAPAELDRVLYAWTYYQGHDFWSPAHHLAGLLGADRAIPLGIQQMCNGAAASIELAAQSLTADPSQQYVLAATADRFAAPGFDRWGDLGLAYGDGATAVLISRRPLGRSARLLASADRAMAQFEGMHRGCAPFAAAPGDAARGPLRPRTTKREFQQQHPDLDFPEAAKQMLAAVISSALEQAGIDPAGAGPAVVALPRFAAPSLETYRAHVEDAAGASLVLLGETTGHLGAGDVVANLADLLGPGGLRIGERIVLVCAGAGFTWSALVLEVSS